MDPRHLSQSSLVSALSDELDRIEVRDDIELNSISQRSAADTHSALAVVTSENQHLLDQAEGAIKRDHASSQRLARTKNTVRAEIDRVKEFLCAYNPITAVRLKSLWKSVTSSGPVTHVDTDLSTSGSKFRRKHNLHGWRMGVFLSLIAITICLVIELVMLILAMALNKPEGDRRGIGILYKGNCAKVERLKNLVGIPLNIIATVLLATSNYVMQCLSAPSRKEVDEAHVAGSYMNIGISSVHNLFHKLSWKSLLWITLMLTTIPIHLFVNSAFFGALQARNYGVLIASEGWANEVYNLNWNEIEFNGTFGLDLGHQFASIVSGEVEYDDANPSEAQILTKLTPSECFQRYSTQLQSDASNVVLIVNQTTAKYRLAPSLSDNTTAYHNYIPDTAFAMREGVGMYIDPFSGKAVPVFSESSHWTSAITLANVSEALLYFEPTSPDYENVYSLFTSFDYHYWTTVKQYDYDFNNSKILTAGQWNPNSWMCPVSYTLNGTSCTGGSKVAPTPWKVTPQEYEVIYCLSEDADEECIFQYSFHILLIIIVCDIVKIAAMAATLWIVNDNPLATIGDAVASFMTMPDLYTRGCCLMNTFEARKVTRGHLSRHFSRLTSRRHSYKEAGNTLSDRVGHEAFYWRAQSAHWYSAPSRNRWYTFITLYVGIFGMLVAVLGLGIRRLRERGINNPFSQGFGAINPNAVFAYPTTFEYNGTTAIAQTSKPEDLFADVVTVNTPQLLFSTLYFLYNGMFTCMLTAAEWSQFAKLPKRLRVSEPKVGQRSTYWLQLPWKYSLPLLGISSLLHWLVSQSLFIVRIVVTGWNDEEEPDRDISACGYSPIAILMVIIVVFISVVVLGIMSFRKLTPGIPICGTNSLAIAAACHAGIGDQDEFAPLAECRPLRWGVVKPAEKSAPGHCCITDEMDIGQLVDGMEYR